MGGSIEQHRRFIVRRYVVGLEASANKRKYVFMSLEQNAGPNHNAKAGNKSFEKVQVYIFGNNPEQMKITFMKKLGAD